MSLEKSIVTSLSPPRNAWALTLSLVLGACSTSGYLDVGKQAPDDPAPGTNNGAGGAWVSATPPGSGAGGNDMIPPPMTTSPPIITPPAATPPAALPPARVTDDGIPPDVFAILQGRCSPCHTYGQGDVAGWGSVLDLSRMIDAEIVVPGKPGASRMIDRVVVRGDMPPKGDRVPAADVDKLRAWITDLKRPLGTPAATRTSWTRSRPTC